LRFAELTATLELDVAAKAPVGPLRDIRNEVREGELAVSALMLFVTAISRWRFHTPSVTARLGGMPSRPMSGRTLIVRSLASFGHISVG
jgi:hypothetical protein